MRWVEVEWSGGGEFREADGVRLWVLNLNVYSGLDRTGTPLEGVCALGDLMGRQALRATNPLHQGVFARP